MDNRKVLLFAVLVILLALVGLNFKGITGKQLGGGVVIELSPTDVDCRRQDSSKIIYVFVDAGSVGVDQKFYMHRADDGTRVGGSSDNLCPQSICTGAHSKNYRLSCGLPSEEYFFRFTRDNYNLVFDSEVFTLTHSG
ncbi:MAG: hypothetical protein ABIB47_00940 [Candidatus Woesearchaeota archaeon]